MSKSLVNLCVGLCLFAATSLQPAALMAQEEKQPPQPDVQQETQTPVENSGELVLPPPLGGFSPRLTSNPETQEKRKLLVGGVDINGLYIDNAFTVGSKAVDDFQYSILPSIGFRSFTPGTQWVLNYGGGLTMDQRISGNSQMQQTADAELCNTSSHAICHRSFARNMTSRTTLLCRSAKLQRCQPSWALDNSVLLLCHHL